MRSPHIIGVALVALSLGLVACGGSDPNDTADASSDRQKIHDAELKFAQCMRGEGVDFPDPGSDGSSRIRVGPGTGNDPEEFEAAEKACDKYRKAIPRPEISEADQEEFKRNALAHARCMREHGVDFPDPEFTAEGGARVRLKNIDPEDSDFKAAEEACQKYMKKPGATK
jgi:hypothetical protein